MERTKLSPFIISDPCSFDECMEIITEIFIFSIGFVLTESHKTDIYSQIFSYRDTFVQIKSTDRCIFFCPCFFPLYEKTSFAFSSFLCPFSVEGDGGKTFSEPVRPCYISFNASMNWSAMAGSKWVPLQRSISSKASWKVLAFW